MNLPIDDMLSDLRTLLDQFDALPTYSGFDDIQKETRRIERACEEELE